MTKNEFLLNYRISLLKRAKSINNISKACRELGVSRSVYYKYLKRYLKHGREGLYDKKRSKPVMPNDIRRDLNIKNGDRLLVIKRRDDAGLILLKQNVMDDFMTKIQDDDKFFNKVKKS